MATDSIDGASGSEDGPPMSVVVRPGEGPDVRKTYGAGQTVEVSIHDGVVTVSVKGGGDVLPSRRTEFQAHRRAARARAWATLPWKLRKHARSKFYRVRFSHSGVRYEESTGTADLEEAHERAARFYAKIISGEHRPRRITWDERLDRLMWLTDEEWVRMLDLSSLPLDAVDVPKKGTR